MDTEIIQQLCTDRNPLLWQQLSKDAQEVFIAICYRSLFFKVGDLNLAKWILNISGEIKIVQNYIIKNNKNMNGLGILEKLYRFGVSTIPIIDPKDLKQVNEEYHKTRVGFPEYERIPLTELTPNGEELVYVLGKFAALGNPSSFHNEWVRKYRMMCYKAVRKEILKPLLKSSFAINFDNGHTEMLFDRIMWRIPGQQPPRETFHRDVIPSRFIDDHDEVFGGWLNTDMKSQYFSAIPGSHLGISLKTLQPGFARVANEDLGVIKMDTMSFECPPGHMIIFPQYIVHEVLSKIATRYMGRIFTGWRLSNSPRTLHPDKVERMRKQAIMQLPSNQEPPMFSSHHNSAWLQKPFHLIDSQNPLEYSTLEWGAETFKDSLMEDIKGIIRLPRYLKSLEYYSKKDSTIKKYREYGENEIKMYLPIAKSIDI